MKKKLLGILFVLGLLLALPSVVSFAETASGTCGAQGNEANVTWVLDDNGTLTISGSGAMADYNIRFVSAPWYYNYRATIKTVVIEDGVTNIGDYAFNGCVNLTLIYIPDGCNDGTSAIPSSALSKRIVDTLTLQACASSSSFKNGFCFIFLSKYS